MAAVTLPEIKAVLRRLAAEHPDHRDPRVTDGLPPRYVHHGQPVCLVAAALHRLGYTIAQLKQLDREGPHTAHASSGGIVLAKSRHPILQRLDRVGRELLDHVQHQQDRGGYFTWDRVVAEALDLTDFDRQWAAHHLDRVPSWRHDDAREYLVREVVPARCRCGYPAQGERDLEEHVAAMMHVTDGTHHG